jgi:hypothetical protein
VTRISIARQRLGKHIPSQANSRKNMTSIASQRLGKHASLTIKAVFSVESMQSGYKEIFGQENSSRVERDVSLPGYELGIELSW